MTVTTIILIILGVICIIISVVATSEGDKKELTEGVPEELNEDDKEHIKKLVDDFVLDYGKEKAEATAALYDESINEKLKDIDEYFNGLNEEQKRNKEEVNSVYNMICDKQKDIKISLTLMDEYKKGVEKLVAEAESKMVSVTKENEVTNEEETEKAEEKAEETAKETEEAVEAETEVEEAETEETAEETEEAAETEEAEAEATEETEEAEAEETEETEEAEAEETAEETEEVDEDEYDDNYEPTNSLDEILQNEGIDIEGGSTEENVIGMYNAGFSILEIAKLLGLGVGEVKSVVDKYQGR